MLSKSLEYTSLHVPTQTVDEDAPFPSSHDIFTSTYGFIPQQSLANVPSPEKPITLEKILRLPKNPTPLERMFARERAVAQLQTSGRRVYSLAPLAPKQKLRPQGPPPASVTTLKRPLPSSPPLNVSFGESKTPFRVNSANKALDAAETILKTTSFSSFGNITSATDRTTLSQRIYTPSIAETRATNALEEELRQRRHASKIHCSFYMNNQCKFALATRQCFGCKIFDSKKTGFMCESCWKNRHPWHREKHEFVFIQQEPNTPPKKIIENEVADQVSKETRSLIKATQASALSMGAPLEGSMQEERLKKAAGTCDSLIERVAGLILRLRDDEFVRRERAAALIQRLQRRKWGRRFAERVARLSWGKVYDPGTGLFYYVHRSDRSRTQWNQPTLFGKLVDVKELPERLAFEMTENEAATCIQKMVRNVFVKRMISQLAMAAFRRSIDKATGRVFYYNMHSRTAHWTKPKSLGEIEPPFYSVFEDDRAIQTACKLVQNTWRKHKAKKIFLKLVAESFERVWDPSNGRYFYYSKNTGESRWTRPFALLLGAHGIKDEDIPEALPEADIEAEAEHGVESAFEQGEEKYYSNRDQKTLHAINASSSSSQNVKNMTEERAKAIVASFIRIWRARRTLITQVGVVWNRVYDEEYSAYFFFNTVTGESTWYKPKIIKRLGIELPVTEEDEDEEGREEGGEEKGETNNPNRDSNTNEKTFNQKNEDKDEIVLTKQQEGEEDDEDDDRNTFLTAREEEDDDDHDDVEEDKDEKDRDTLHKELHRIRFDRQLGIENAKTEDVLGPLMRERELMSKSLAKVNSRASLSMQPPPTHGSRGGENNSILSISNEDDTGHQIIGSQKPLKKKSSKTLSKNGSSTLSISDAMSSTHSSLISAQEGVSSSSSATMAAAGGGLRAISYLSSSRSVAGATTTTTKDTPSPPRVVSTQRPTSATSAVSTSASSSLVTAITRLSNESSRKSASLSVTTANSVPKDVGSVLSGISGSIGSSASRTLAPSDALRVHWRRLQSFAAHSRPQGNEKMYSEDELMRRFRKLGTRIWVALCSKYGNDTVQKFMIGLTYLDPPYAFPGPSWKPQSHNHSKSSKSSTLSDGKEKEDEEEDVFFVQQLTARTENSI
jgi:hypothetical protein